jgi:hypothetical protein
VVIQGTSDRSLAATGTHPLIPMDIVEATYMQPPPDSILSRMDLIMCRAIALQKRPEDLEKLHGKVYEACRKAAVQFEEKYIWTINDFNFK